jgi:hypothetical protein
VARCSSTSCWVRRRRSRRRWSRLVLAMRARIGHRLPRNERSEMAGSRVTKARRRHPESVRHQQRAGYSSQLQGRCAGRDRMPRATPCSSK